MSVCYNVSMESNYYRTKTSVSMIRYHVVFCPKYRRKIFNIPGVEDAFKSIVAEACKAHDIRILVMECHVDHVHMFISCPPKMSPADAVKIIKGCTSITLRRQFPELSHMSSLWTRSYFASTAGDVSAATIEKYIATQKTRPVSKKHK